MSGGRRDEAAMPADYEALAGMSDEAVSNATGRSWPEWTELLDGAGASSMPHNEIAAWVRENHEGVSGWWAQSVTVAYERFRGIRDVGQRRDGGYDVNKSKTFPVPVERLWSAFADESRRSEWLPEELEVRTATEPRSMRVRLADGTPLDAYFKAKTESKSSVSLQQRGLPDKAAADDRRAYWGERLDELGRVLES